MSDLLNSPPRLGAAVAIRPARPGLIVPDPDLGDLLPAEGRTVAWSTYWHRLAQDGDVIAVPPVSHPASTPADRPGRAPSTEA
jgi:hypothetical protein